MLPLEDSHTLMLANKEAVQKIVDRKENTVPYLGLNLQTSRSPSVIDSHCRNSYMSATRKLQASRAKVRFYVAGENSNCAIYAVSPQRFSTFDQLLAGLIKSPICRGTQGKKYIFNLQTSHKITALEELNPVETYVCATYEVFDQLDKSARTPSPVQKVRTSNKLQPTAAAIVASRQLGTSQSTRNHLQTQTPTIEESEECLFIKEIKPKLITVLKCGSRPRRSVRILLNNKNVRTFEQVVKGISEILSPDDPIRRIYGSSTGKLVMCIADFFLSDKIFISFGNEKMNPEDLVLDRSEVRTVGAYRFKHASAYGRVTLNSHQSAPVGMRPKTIATQSANTSQYLPSRQVRRERNIHHFLLSKPNLSAVSKTNRQRAETTPKTNKEDRSIKVHSPDPFVLFTVLVNLFAEDRPTHRITPPRNSTSFVT